jgi:hypothetical protein
MAAFNLGSGTWAGLLFLRRLRHHNKLEMPGRQTPCSAADVGPKKSRPGVFESSNPNL